MNIKIRKSLLIYSNNERSVFFIYVNEYYKPILPQLLINLILLTLTRPNLSKIIPNLPTCLYNSYTACMWVVLAAGAGSNSEMGRYVRNGFVLLNLYRLSLKQIQQYRDENIRFKKSAYNIVIGEE